MPKKGAKLGVNSLSAILTELHRIGNALTASNAELLTEGIDDIDDVKGEYTEFRLLALHSEGLQGYPASETVT